MDERSHNADAELALLVDGRLDRARAAELEGDPQLSRRIALIRAGREQLRAAAAAVEAPFELRRRVDELGPARPRRRWRPFAALSAAGVAAALVLVLALAGGAPSVGDVLDAAGGSPSATLTPTGGPLLPGNVDGVRHPDYEEKFGWRAVGQREDEVGGRLVRTVVYRKGGRRVSYSIVAGEPLEEPDGEDLEAEGTRLRRIGATNAVTWRRGGRTCVIVGSPGVSLATVAELAGWKAKGEIPF